MQLPIHPLRRLLDGTAAVSLPGPGTYRQYSHLFTQLDLVCGDPSTKGEMAHLPRKSHVHLLLLLPRSPSLLAPLHSVWAGQGDMAVAALIASAALSVGTAALGITHITSGVRCDLPKMQV